MVKSVGTKTLFDAIEAIKKGEITSAIFNKFQVRKSEGGEIRISQTSSNYTSFPVDAEFVCYLETFEKQDLKPGMLVQTKNKDVYLVLDEECIICEDEFVELDGYDDKLFHKRNPNYDIIAVYKRKANCSADLRDIMNLSLVDKIADIKR